MVHCITIDLGAPVAASDPYIHLDSFVSYAAAVETVGVEGLDKLDDGGEPEYWEDEMPFEQYQVDDEWVWATSAAHLPGEDDELNGIEHWSTTRWRSRFDHDPKHQTKETQINISSGEFKSYNAALPYAAANSLRFFFEGDADRVQELIDTHVPAIGKKRSQGFGSIKETKVMQADEIESAIYYNGRVLRSLPTQFAPKIMPGVRYERRTVRPPYWHAANQEFAFEPFEEVPRENFVDEVGLSNEVTG